MIALLALGKEYGKFAFNLAVSLKHHSDVKIQLIHDESALSHFTALMREYFDLMTTIDKSDYEFNGVFSPGWAKLNLDKYIKEDSIYLDVDGVATKDIMPLYEKLKGHKFTSQIFSLASKDDGDSEGLVWMYTQDIWGHFGLKDTDKLPCINSSFMWITKDSGDFFKLAREEYKNIPKEKLRTKWGTGFPDELAFCVAMAKMGLTDIVANPVCFAQKRMEFKDIMSYEILSVYGMKGLVHDSVLSIYDKLMFKYCSEKGFNHIFKINNLMKHKYAGKK
jgi:hypothetical protein